VTPTHYRLGCAEVKLQAIWEVLGTREGFLFLRRRLRASYD
jgi:hypothetical protein